MPRILLIRVCVTLIVGIIVILLTIRLLRPRPEAPGDAKFMHCDVCKQEMLYNPKLAGGKCPRCQPPKIGTLIATKSSVGQGYGNPWRQLNIALGFEGIILLGAVVWILSTPPRGAGQIQYAYTQCKNCGRRLRFPAHRAGAGAGWCPLCKAMFRYPTEQEEPIFSEFSSDEYDAGP
jgi:hypothetical protein